VVGSQKIIILENTYYTVLSLRMEILRHFKLKGYEIYVLSKAEKNDIELLEKEGFHCRPVGTVMLNPIMACQFFFKLFQEIKQIQPKIIFSFTIRPNIFGSLAARFLSIPIVSNVTGTGPLTTDNGLVYRLIRLAYKFAFSKNQRVFFQNQDDLEFFFKNKYVKKEQAKLLPGSGVDTDYYMPRPKTNKGFTFLMVSRLIVDKGVRDYVEAARIVKAKYPEVQFCLLGPYWQQSTSKNTITEAEVKAWQEEGLINYLGYTLDVRPCMAEADAIVLPSYREGCANVLMQGASMAKPLIATKVTGCRNLIENGITGFLCEVQNPHSLAEKMIDLYKLAIKKRLEMGMKGREKMVVEYQKKLVLEAYEQELARIL
jgi:glycosyltransferase involved in cell wall biosynthesis